jgi:hypothetical protein
MNLQPKKIQKICNCKNFPPKEKVVFVVATKVGVAHEAFYNNKPKISSMLGLLFFLDVFGLHSLSILYIMARISMLKMEKISHISHT